MIAEQHVLPAFPMNKGKSNMQYRHHTFLLAISLAMVSTSGCDKVQKAAEGVRDAGSAVTQAATGAQADTEKFNHYTDGFNELIDDNSGIPHYYQEYVESEPTKQDSNDNISFYVSPSSLERAIESLKKGRALSSSDPVAKEADAAIDKLLPSAEKLLLQQKELEPYFTSKAYRDDKLAKAKAAHASLVANYEATIAGIHALDEILTRHQRAQATAQAEEQKAAGNMPLYHTIRTMQLAEAIVSSAQQEKYAEADKLLPELEASVAAMKKAQDAAPKEPGDTNPINISLISDRVNSMIGDYRDFKQSKDAEKLNDMVGHYNDAINEYGDIKF